MTNEEAIKVLNMIEAHGSLPIQAKEKAIQALEAQTSHDDIREAYIKGYDYGVKDWFKAKTESCEDAVSREAVRQIIIKNNESYGYSDRVHHLTAEIFALPSVSPQRPKGKWIKYEVDIAPHPLHCSICGFSSHHIRDEYIREFRRCPNCGAEMGGGEDK